MSEGSTSGQEVVQLRRDIRRLLEQRLLEAVELVLEQELQEVLGAQPYERTAVRRGYRNGATRRRVTTVAGTRELRVPRGRVATPEGRRMYPEAPRIYPDVSLPYPQPFRPHLPPLREPPGAAPPTREPREPYTSAMLEWSDCPAVERGAGKVSGAWVFKGTRVPVRALFENLEDGAPSTISWSGSPA